MTRTVAVALLLALSLSAAGAQGGERDKNRPAPAETESDATLWGALLFAEDSKELEDRAPTAVESTANGESKTLDAISGRLDAAFPGKKFALLGEHSQEIFSQYESWVVPSKDLFLKIDSRGPAESGGMLLHIQLWHNENVIVKTDAVLKANSPLFIGGPGWRGGRLIFVVMLTAQKA
ncbi:MAG: hypothetical protein ACC661_06140 [Verrucomicrobiales bacterium]